MGEESWVVEAALQFVRQPLWTTPVQNFIDSNCASFDDEEELKLEYTTIHKKFQELIEGIMEAMLSELGAAPETLVEALQAQQETDKNIKRFLQYLYSLDDFRSFRAMMVKRNIELEAEAMEAWSKMQQYNAQQAIQGSEAAPPAAEGDETPLAPPQPTEDDPEAKELQLALQASLAVSEKIIKEAEVEDADLQAALALSLAEEQERLAKDEAKAAAEAEAAKESAEKAKQDAEARAAADEAAKAEADKQVAEQRQKEKEAELAQKRAQAEAEMKAKEAAVLQERKEKVTAAVAAAEEAREQEKKDPNAPAVTRVSLTEVTDKSKGPAPLGEISGHRKTGGFGKFGALPDIQPSFSSLKAEASVTVKQANPVRAQAEEEEERKKSAEQKAAEEKRAKEEMEARAKYMAEQRRKIVEAKKQKRQGELDAFAAENNLPASPAPASAPTATGGDSGSGPSSEDKAHQEMTRALMRRFKDDIIQESTK